MTKSKARKRGRTKGNRKTDTPYALKFNNQSKHERESRDNSTTQLLQRREKLFNEFQKAQHPNQKLAIYRELSEVREELKKRRQPPIRFSSTQTQQLNTRNEKLDKKALKKARRRKPRSVYAYQGGLPSLGKKR